MKRSRYLCLISVVLFTPQCRDFLKSFERRRAIERNLRPREFANTGDPQKEKIVTPAFDHHNWQKTLSGTVKQNGDLDLKNLNKRKKYLQNYLKALAACDPTGYVEYEWDALMINAFNAFILQAILESKNPKENGDLRTARVWTEDRFLLGGVTTDLRSLQQLLFDTFPHPQLKSTLYYGTDSVPPLRFEPYTGSKLVEQMHDQEKWLKKTVEEPPANPFKDFEQGIPVKPERP